MASKQATIALISGANAGIGRAVAIQLAKDHGFHVIIGSRNAASGEEVAASLQADGAQATSVQLDIDSDESIAAAVRTIETKFGVIDVLINNAAILLDTASSPDRPRMSTRELFSRTLSTNVAGTACLTEACLPLLRKSTFPRLVFVSSRMGSLVESINKDNLWYSIDYKAYDSSKAAVNILAVNYARIFEEMGGVSNAVCPGLVQTKLTNNHPMGTSTELGAQRIVELAIAKKGSPTATFTAREGVIPW